MGNHVREERIFISIAELTPEVRKPVQGTLLVIGHPPQTSRSIRAPRAEISAHFNHYGQGDPHDVIYAYKG